MRKVRSALAEAGGELSDDGASGAGDCDREPPDAAAAACGMAHGSCRRAPCITSSLKQSSRLIIAPNVYGWTTAIHVYELLLLLKRVIIEFWCKATSFIWSLLRAGVQPTLVPSAETKAASQGADFSGCRKFNVTLARREPIWHIACLYSQLNDLFRSEDHSGDCQCFWMGRATPKITPSPWSIWTPI